MPNELKVIWHYFYSSDCLIRNLIIVDFVGNLYWDSLPMKPVILTMIASASPKGKYGNHPQGT